MCLFTPGGTSPADRPRGCTQFLNADATRDRLLPVLVGIADLLPWLKQWHNAIDPEYRMRMGDFYEKFVDGEARRHGATTEAVATWRLEAPN